MLTDNIPSFWNLEIYKIIPAEKSQYYPLTTPPETTCKFEHFDDTVFIGEVYFKWGITTFHVHPYVRKKFSFQMIFIYITFTQGGKLLSLHPFLN